MSRDWTPEEIQIVSREMKKAGHMSYDEFCEALDRDGFVRIIREVDENKENKTE